MKWAYQTSVKTPTGDTPFAFTYKSEAVIPVEIGMPTHRVKKFDPYHGEDGLKENLDLSEEKWQEAAMRMTN